MDKDFALSLLRRIDLMEERLMKRIDVHDRFRSKFLGGMAVVVFFVPIAIEWLKK